MQHTYDVVLVLGSGPNAPEARHWPKAMFDRIVTINNAWAVRPDWDDLIFPEDFPAARRPAVLKNGQRAIEAAEFVPAQNACGGVVFAGGTMAFTAGYWVLHALRPRVMAFLGCDMVYPETGPTHYYGTGTADPLRCDVTLRDLGAKSARLGALAAAAGCRCVNLSTADSRLLFPRAPAAHLRGLPAPSCPESVGIMREREAALKYAVPSGRYWEEAARFDVDALDQIDAGWRSAWADMVRAQASGVAA
ncbi:MAG: hypothetical protein AAF636_16400 [Pseudomonadota bacterium]